MTTKMFSNKKIVALSMTYVLLLSLVMTTTSCKHKQTKEKERVKVVALQPVNVNAKDTVREKVVNSNLDSVGVQEADAAFASNKNLKVEAYIKHYPNNQKKELIAYISWLRKEWQNVPNPFIASYQGNDFGDYFHVIFEDQHKKVYDFGQAKNNFGRYDMFDNTGQYEDNPDYLGKKFKVYWNWELADFSCCDGAYGEAKAYVPTVTKLELLKD